MSARQPFIPLPKSQSLVSMDTEQTLGADNFNEAADVTRAPRSSAPENTPMCSASPLSAINKPLNISGFAKNRPSNTRKSIEDSSRIRSPLPSFSRISSATGLHSTTSFRFPLVQSAPRSRYESASDDFSANKAHIPTLHPGLDDADAVQTGNAVSSQPPDPRPRKNTRYSIERPSERLGEEPYGHRNSEDDNCRTVDSTNQEHLRTELRDDAYTSADCERSKPPFRHPKRVERPDELELGDHQNVAKRARAGIELIPTNDDQAVYGSDFGTPPPPPPFSLSTIRTPSPPPYARQRLEDIREDHAIRRLLGRDLDSVVDAHLSNYNESKNRWSECSEEEWMAGAKEICAKFSGLMDFVKEHMERKLNLYTSLQSTISAHRTVLAGREETLKIVRDSLVRESGKVVSTKLNDTQDSEGVQGTSHLG